MKNIFIVFALLFSSISFAQITHTVGGNTVQLTEEITGNASLFYTVLEGTHRYFIKKDDTITELTNTRNNKGKYQQEYKELLSILTADAPQDVSNVNLTLGSLATYIDNYNVKSDMNYKMQKERPKAKARAGVFAGITNHPFVTNAKNTTVPTFGAEIEIYDEKRTRHSLALQIKQSLSGSDLDYTATQASFNYRFRVVNTAKFAIYPQVKFATITHSKSTSTSVDTTVTPNKIITHNSSGTAFDGPIILGLGADVKLGMGYLTFAADELVAAFLDNKGNFPLNLSMGYKFNL